MHFFCKNDCSEDRPAFVYVATSQRQEIDNYPCCAARVFHFERKIRLEGYLDRWLRGRPDFADFYG